MKKIAFIGAGKMATAIGGGFMKKSASQWTAAAYDVSEAAAAKFTETTGISCCASLKETLADADVILIAVKPQFLVSAVEDAKTLFGNALIISIVAGVPLEKLTALTGTERIVRVMPNTPALVGAGMSCFTPGKAASVEDIKTAEAILSSFGRCEQIPERLMNAVTGLSGSGPAYVFEFIMALADGGVYEGLPRAMAIELAAQTVLGSAKMVLESNEHPAVLRDAVISPAGTTARGVAALDEGAFRSLVVKSVVASAEYSAELGKKC